MKIKITKFFYSVAPRDLSASVMEIGPNAGPDTWRASMDESADTVLLDTAEKREAFAEWAEQSGMDNVRDMSDTEVNALFLQWIAGDMREMGIHKPITDPASADWDAIERNESIPSNIFRGVDGEIYFYAGS